MYDTEALFFPDVAEGAAVEEEVPELVTTGRVEVMTGDVALTLVWEAPC